MMTVCSCGMDCSEFVGQHAIPADAAFACPACDAQLTATGPDRDFIPVSDLPTNLAFEAISD